LYLAGALLELVGTVFGASGRAEVAGLAAVFVIAAGVGGLFWLGAARLPVRLAPVAVALGSVLIAAAIHWSGEGVSSFAFIYLWVGLYSAYFFSRRQTAGQLGLAGLTYAAVLASEPAGTAPAVRWLISMATVVVAVFLIRVLRHRVDRLVASVTRDRRRLAEAQAVARVGSWEWDIAADRIDWSDELWRIYGLEAGSRELSLADLRELDHPDDRERVGAVIEAARTKGEPFSFEHRIVRPDGTVRNLQGHGEVIAGPDGQAIGMRGTAQDITRRVDREAALRRSSRYFEVSHDLICTAGFDGYFKELNAAWTQTLGWSEPDLRERPLIEFVHPEDRESTREEIAALIGGAGTVDFVSRMETEAGGWCWFHWSAIVAPDEELIYASARDITERKGVEAALAESERRTRREAARRQADERFRTAFDRAPIGVCLVALEGADQGRLLQVNRALANILGRSVAELTGVPIGTLTHPEDQAGLDADLREMAEGRRGHVEREQRVMHKGGHFVWVLISATLLSDADGPPNVAVTHVMDISDRKQFDGRLQHLADHDALTGLYNRRRFTEELEQELKRSRRFAESGAVLFLDLDGFKFVNDSLGHAAGDEMIIRVARLLGSTVRETDTLARVGGDEFAVLLPRCDAGTASLVAEKLLGAVRRHGLAISENRYAQVSTSIGIAPFSGGDDLSADEVVVEADIAMYDAKEAGKDRYVIYERAHGRRERMRVDQNWNQRLRRALEEDRFVLHAQPIMPISACGAPGFELLLRLPDAHGDLIPPGSFLSNAERFGLIDKIDHWVLGEAVRHLSSSHAAGADLMLTVNVSGKTMGDAGLGAYVESLLVDHPIRPDRLVIEITETAAIINIERAHHLAQELRALGCRMALDDFGAGFASFYYLKHLEFDYLKIDGEFIRNLCATPTDQLVVQAVVTVAAGLDTTTIAEFVGDDETLGLLKVLGVGYGQGYHLGRPAALAQTLPYLISAHSKT
ncbi:MAG TPA: EAL domain-containing protein, partial [Solirubrobacteraceae bacterium]|nr:EAL domain-containing protein [Solirubrobacteraceae bacterium]